MATKVKGDEAVFRVIDAMAAPLGGWILRLRLHAGSAPTLSALTGATLQVESPAGEVRTMKVEGFAVFGGKITDERLQRTGRVDVRVLEGGADERGEGEEILPFSLVRLG